MTNSAVAGAQQGLIAGKRAALGADQVKEAARKVAAQLARTTAIPSHARAKALAGLAAALLSRRDEFASLIVDEVAKPLKEARREVDRAIFTIQWASEEAKRFGGEWFPIDFDANTEGRMAVVRRFPRGPALFISPFNFPLNLVVHKLAPAVAAGVPFVLKPPPQAPEVSLRLGEMLAQAGWPAEAFAVLPCGNDVAEQLVRMPEFRVLSFTGSAGVGWKLKEVGGKKHCVLELGGNAAVAVAEDADLPWAAARCAWGGFYYSGQVCISVQRIYVQKSVYADFKSYFLANVAELKVGDPKDEKTDIGPLISDEAAARVEGWIEEAKAAGAVVLAGGPRKGRTIPPTVLEKVPPQCKVVCEEIFGPVAVLDAYENWTEVLERINAGAYGLQAGVFTKDMGRILQAWNTVRVGGLIVNDIPAFRSDAMPYGGAKDSGLGREGVRYAMEEYTEPRTLVLKS